MREANPFSFTRPAELSSDWRVEPAHWRFAYQSQNVRRCWQFRATEQSTPIHTAPFTRKIWVKIGSYSNCLIIRTRNCAKKHLFLPARSPDGTVSNPFDS